MRMRGEGKRPSVRRTIFAQGTLVRLKTVEVAGIEWLRHATALLQRVRISDPHIGIWEAADVQWWWRRSRASDQLEQTFWLDEDGPVASVLMTEWGTKWQLDPVAIPDLVPTLVPTAWEAALHRMRKLRIVELEVLCRDDDDLMLEFLAAAGFEAAKESGGVTWRAAGTTTPVAELPNGYRITDRSLHPAQIHWLTRRSTPDLESRLAECSLYDPELDIAIQTQEGDIAAYALFWFDAATSVGLIEPMRTEEPHQRRGLARALIGEGLARLIARGAQRVKVGYSTEAARALYVNSGFEVTHTDHAHRLRLTE